MVCKSQLITLGCSILEVTANFSVKKFGEHFDDPVCNSVVLASGHICGGFFFFSFVLFVFLYTT